MRLSMPLKTTVERTLHGIRSKRTRRKLRAQEFGLMLASRVLRPAHVEVRQFRQAGDIPEAFIVPECLPTSPQTTRPLTARPRSTEGIARVAHFLGSLRGQLATALSQPHARLRHAPLDRRAAIQAARRSMARPLRPQSRVRVRIPGISGLSAAARAREAMLSNWWHKFVAHQRQMAAQRRLLFRFR